MNVYTGIHSYYCTPLLTREAKSICTQEPCTSASWTRMAERCITKTPPAGPIGFCKPTILESAYSCQVRVETVVILRLTDIQEAQYLV
jgi:hypothetical protein